MKDPDCRICGEHPVIHSLQDRPEDYDHNRPIILGERFFISPEELKEKIRSQESIQIIDVRSAVERKISVIPNSRLLPLSQLSGHLSELDSSRQVILYSRGNDQAAAAAKLLLDSGFTNVKVLQGGINAWAARIDPSLFQY